MQFLEKASFSFNLELLENGGSSIVGSGGSVNVREPPPIYGQLVDR